MDSISYSSRFLFSFSPVNQMTRSAVGDKSGPPTYLRAIRRAGCPNLGSRPALGPILFGKLTDAEEGVGASGPQVWKCTTTLRVSVGVQIVCT